jgi:UrcA family protein
MHRSNYSVGLVGPSKRPFSATLGAWAMATVVTLGSFVSLDARASGDEQRSTTVEYAELNLTTQKGVATLYRRLERAARGVCSDTGERVPLAERVVAQRCTKAALADAVKQVDIPELSAMHQARIAGSGQG